MKLLILTVFILSCSSRGLRISEQIPEYHESYSEGEDMVFAEGGDDSKIVFQNLSDKPQRYLRHENKFGDKNQIKKYLDDDYQTRKIASINEEDSELTSRLREGKLIVDRSNVYILKSEMSKIFEAYTKLYDRSKELEQSEEKLNFQIEHRGEIAVISKKDYKNLIREKKRILSLIYRSRSLASDKAENLIEKDNKERKTEVLYSAPEKLYKNRKATSHMRNKLFSRSIKKNKIKKSNKN